jgi:hypothetical protein
VSAWVSIRIKLAGTMIWSRWLDGIYRKVATVPNWVQMGKAGAGGEARYRRKGKSEPERARVDHLRIKSVR